MKAINFLILFMIMLVLCGFIMHDKDPLSTIADDDTFLIEDYSDSNNTKYTTAANLANYIAVPVDWVSVKHPTYGAKGDGSTDDTAAIQAAATAADGSTLYVPYSSGTYIITEKVTVPKDTSVIMDGRIEYSGDGNETALVIGEEGATIENRELTLILDVARGTQSTWSSEDSVGIKLINLYTCNVIIKRVAGFTIGVQCLAAAKGFVYNTITLGNFYGNKIGLDLTNKTIGSDYGWVSENLFLNGKFNTAATLNPSTVRYGIRITSQGTNYYINSSNTFLKPSFEVGADSATPIPILIEYGSLNEFIACREESSATYLAQTENGSYKNVFDIANDSTAGVNDTGDYPGSVIRDRADRGIDFGTKIFDSGAMWENACYYDGNSSIHIPGMCFMKPANATIYSNSIATIGDDNITFSWTHGGPAVFVDTTESKNFALSAKIPTGGNTTSYRIRCYAANGTVLNGNSTTYLKGSDSTYYSLVSWGTNFGGAYYTTHATTKPFLFSVTDHVKKVCVGYAGACDLKSLAVYNLDDRESNVWSGYEDIVKGGNIGTCAPTAGTWETGKTVWNAAATNATQVSGWRCYADGTPGSWTAFGSPETIDNLSVGNLEIDTTLRGSASLWWRATHVCAFSASTGASGATFTAPSSDTLGGYRLDAVGETLYHSESITSQWDGATDLEFKVTFEVGIAGTNATDTVDLKIVFYYKGNDDVACKTQTVEIATVVGTDAQYTRHTAVFTIDWDATDNIVEVADKISMVLNLETDTSEVDDAIINIGMFRYKTTKINPEV